MSLNNQEEIVYMYISMDPMQWNIYDILISFEPLEVQKLEKNPLEFRDVKGLCRFLLKELRDKSLEYLNTFKVNLHGDVYDYNLEHFIRLHAPDLYIL